MLTDGHGVRIVNSGAETVPVALTGTVSAPEPRTAAPG
jgi:hypothetical protein